ncbi:MULTISPECIES: hypothetical protein [unclassified Streptomyces]|uniref:hypothetical protein n=1 Tax=unclassified Streptomyces TaxID=2593676 RepID=UPI0006F5E8BF|nr:MULTISPECIES: hypothetical protein [unclassified Streptomyces]KQX47435.1 hypothetical protein ASD33_21880 [Streptomyces sp. Root1304]KRA94743.1 hypothetical protein ASE09_31105 [Streptomyces sp. Root66D1]
MTTPATAAALRTRPDLHYAPVPGGVYFSGARARFVLRGSEVLHAVAQGCVPLLADGTDEDALVAGIGTERARPAVRLLVDKLRENGLLLDPAAHTAPEPPAAVRERHAESLARLEGLLDDPYGAFARLRAATVLVTGPATATGPAVRGLRRAGVGTVLTGADAPAGTPDAVLDIREDDGTPPVTAWLVVPVLLGGADVTLVGPALTAPGHPAVRAAFRDRARRWAAAEATAPAPRPLADALAGALGAQLLVDTLTGIAATGEAHVVHGTDLVSDPVTVEGTHQAAATGRPGSLPEGPSVLAAAPADPRPEPDEARESAAPLAARWTGPLALTEGADLPQMPLALRAAELRTGGRPTTTVLAWAAHQETATAAVTLAALRSLIPGAPTPAAGPHARIPGAPTPAAGLTREHWLLDGALRLLAEETAPLPAKTATPHVPPAALPAGAPAAAAGGGACGALDPEGLRILAGLRALLPREPEVRLHGVPGLHWLLAEVTADGVSLGRAWGADAAEAARNALCTALARTQTADGAGAVDPLSTDALLLADRAALDALRAGLADRAVTYRGEAVRHDPVLGELPFWYGPVEAHDAH